jgi:hypothetical protein
MSTMCDLTALLADADVRRRAREICKLTSRDGTCPDTHGDSVPPCEPSNCLVWELIEMGRVGHPE